MRMPMLRSQPATVDEFRDCRPVILRDLKRAACNECGEKATGSTPYGYKCGKHWELAWLEEEGEYVTPEMREKWMETP